MSAGRAAAPVAVTGWSLHLPGVDPAGLDGLAALAVPACPPESAHELLGRKGLLGKDPATRLALCAVHRALGLPPRAPRHTGPPDPRTAVVASSNLGNVSTVVDVVRAVRGGGPGAVSPLDAPNASSNVVASTVAIWFGWGGPNLMVCSGATAGLDAVALGALLLRAGRADRVVVVGVEPGDPAAAALHARRAVAAGPLRAGAACVVLEPADGSGRPVLGRSAATGPGRPPAGSSPPDLVVGALYGAQGVAQVAAAAAAVAGPAAPPVRVVCGDAADGWRTLDVHPAAVPVGAAGRTVPAG